MPFTVHAAHVVVGGGSVLAPGRSRSNVRAGAHAPQKSMSSRCRRRPARQHGHVAVWTGEFVSLSLSLPSQRHGWGRGGESRRRERKEELETYFIFYHCMCARTHSAWGWTSVRLGQVHGKNARGLARKVASLLVSKTKPSWQLHPLQCTRQMHIFILSIPHSVTHSGKWMRNSIILGDRVVFFYQTVHAQCIKKWDNPHSYFILMRCVPLFCFVNQTN